MRDQGRELPVSQTPCLLRLSLNEHLKGVQPAMELLKFSGFVGAVLSRHQQAFEGFSGSSWTRPAFS